MTFQNKKNYGIYLASLIVTALLACFMFSINQYAPVQRDGSHFLFMANNIAHGQNPYWASFETKNPLVEYYWSLFFRAFQGDAHITYLARAAETLYLWFTSLMVLVLSCFLLNQQTHKNDAAVSVYSPGINSPIDAVTRQKALSSAVLASLALFFLCSWRVTDTGFNISAYQTLTEGLCILVTLYLFKQPSAGKAILLGVLFFGSWFIKQTSIIAAGLPLLAILVFHKDKKAVLKYVVMAAATSIVLVLLFFLNLYLQDTLVNYDRSTFKFKSLIFSTTNTDFALERFNNALDNAFSLSNPQARFSSYLLLLFLCFPLLLVIDLLRCKVKGAISEGDKLRWVIYAWFVGVMIQACMGLTFYPHYFIAAIVPALLMISLFVYHMGVLQTFTGFLLAITLILYIDYRNEDQTLKDMASAAPISHSFKALSSVIPPEATVFNWGALSHFHVYYEKPSDYPQNMILPYVLIDVDEEKRKAMFKETFESGAPDYFIEYRETLPKFTPLRTFPLTTEYLREWTGKDYRVLANYTPPQGRYGLPVFIYVREDLFLPALERLKSVNKKR